MITSDFGDTWDLILNPAGLDNNADLRAMEFINPNIGYIAGLKGIILKTIDGGYHWELVHYTGSISDEFTDVSLSDPDNAYVIGKNDWIIRTYDGGATWDTLFTQAGFTFTDIDFLNPDTGYIFGGSGEKYLKTTNGGYTWLMHELSLQLPNTTCYDVCFPNPQLGFISCVTVNPYEYYCKFFRTMDGGATWTEVYYNWSFTPSDIGFMNDSIIMVSGYSIDLSNSVASTRDRGNTWTQSYLSGRLQAIVCDTIEKALVVGLYGDIFKTTDNGLSWQVISTRYVNGDITNVLFIDENKGFLIADLLGGEVPGCALYGTLNGGDSWSYCFSPPGIHGVVLFYDENNGFTATNFPWDHWLYKTTDGGTSWSGVEPTNNPDFEFANCLRFHDENFGFLATDEFLFQTTDGGLTWTARVGDYFTDIELNHWPVCFATGTGGLYRSGDGGTTWQLVNIPNGTWLNDMFFLNYYNVYLCGNGNKILRSDDGGMTWEQLQVTTPHYINFKSIYFKDLSTGFAVGEGPYETMVYTQDGGDTWEVMLSISTSALTKITFLNQNTGLIFGKNGLILKTENGGITGTENWTALLNRQLTLFPNPSCNKLTIILPGEMKQDFILEIHNNAGSMILSKRFHGRTGTLNVDISSLKNGVYIVNLSISNRSYAAKFIKF
jgi:photosystem II stability/assembly factor-like uncharacterized protein